MPELVTGDDEMRTAVRARLSADDLTQCATVSSEVLYAASPGEE